MAATAKAILKSPAVKPLTKRKAWAALKAHHKTVQSLHLRKLFDDDPKRGERFTAEALGIYLDYSKNRITDKTLKLFGHDSSTNNLISRYRKQREITL